MNVLLLALAAVNPLSYPSYEQKVVAEFASPAEAAAGGCGLRGVLHRFALPERGGEMT